MNNLELVSALARNKVGDVVTLLHSSIYPPKRGEPLYAGSFSNETGEWWWRVFPDFASAMDAAADHERALSAAMLTLPSDWSIQAAIKRRKASSLVGVGSMTTLGAVKAHPCSYAGVINHARSIEATEQPPT